MKKNYTSFLTGFLLVLAGYSAFAQAPTITSAHLPTAGTTYNQMDDSTAADLPSFMVTAGASSAQTWNYTSVFAHTYADPISFVAPSGLSGASNFASANLGGSQSGNSLFFTSNTSGLVLDGYYANTGAGFAAVPFTPSEVIIPTPFTYGNSQNNAFVSTVTIATTYSGTPIVVKQVQHSTRTLTGDAFGSLTTPGGTFSSTLRIKAYQVDVDTQFVYLGTTASGTPIQTSPSRDSSLTYEWVQNNSPVILMEIDMNGAGTVVTGANYSNGVTTGIVSLTSPFTELSVYPNPATTAANLTYENKYATHVTINMFDISGRFIATLANENQSVGKQTLSIDTKALQLNSGLYFVRISGANGSETIKLSVN